MNKRQAIIAEIPRLRRFARGLVRDSVAADDLVQDCLERALGRLHLWHRNTNMRAWLFTILRNLYLNQLRDLARRPGEISYEEHHDISERTLPVQEIELSVRDIGHALDKLPDLHKEVILLIGLEGMSYKETADIVGAPVGTVMSRLARGRKALRSLMETGYLGDKPPLRRVK